MPAEIVPASRPNSGRDARTGQFLPGASGNPKGRSKGDLTTFVRTATKEGRTIVQLFLRIVEGKRVNGESPTTAEMMHAGEWLADRGWGRPVQAIDTSSPVTIIIAGSWDAE